MQWMQVPLFHKLPALGNNVADLTNTVKESISFIAACYGHVEATSMTELLFKVWKHKTARANIVTATRLMALTPRTEAFGYSLLLSMYSGNES